MKLVIEIPEEAKQAFDCAESNDLKGCYYDHGGVIGNAIKNGKPLDVVLDEIREEIVELQKEYQEYGWAYDDALEVIDKYKAERGDER